MQVQHCKAIVSTANVRVTVNERPAGCRMCGGPVRVQKTFEHSAASLEHGEFRAVEPVYVCKSGCQSPGRKHAIHRAPTLATCLPRRKTSAYDVMVHVGLGRVLYHQQRDETARSLLEDHGIRRSAGTITALTASFLERLQRLHIARADALRAALQADGGSPWHVDATGEQGQATLLLAYAGWRRWVLGAWKVSTERSDAILPRLKWLVPLFGTPCAVVRDLGKAVVDAAQQFVKELGLSIPLLGCHQHFLRDIGTDLLKDSHDQLRDLVRQMKIRTGLTALARDLSRGLGSDLHEAREGFRLWQVAVNQGHDLPEGSAGVACVRGLAEWVLDYGADGADEGFPYDQPYLDLYERGCVVRRAVDEFLRRPHSGNVVTRALHRLGRVLESMAVNDGFARAASILKARLELFEKLREALRLTPKQGRRDASRMHVMSVEEAVAELHDIRTAVLGLQSWLVEMRPERGPAADRRRAIDIIVRHLDKHGPSLWGHVIQLPPPPNGPGGVRIADRTNNIEEGFFHKMKHDLRRQSGNKNLRREMDNLPAAAALARNLLRPDYVELTCGSLENLPRVFAELDSQQQIAPPTCVSAAESALHALEDADVVSASLPITDRRLIRTAELATRILAAASSRAPRVNLAPE